ncbi:diphthamide biosynthesis protein 3 [Pancytospora epiphaga]|nr:diphthamide biosynthesis protein 3 [Pancytospora epiphaga]
MVDYDKYFDSLPGDGDFISYYDEVDILDFTYHSSSAQFTYPCPCGDLFIISLVDMQNGETVARCPSCSLIVLVTYEKKDLEKYASVDDSIL